MTTAKTKADWPAETDPSYWMAFEIILDGEPTEVMDLPWIQHEGNEAKGLRRAQQFAFRRHRRAWDGSEGMDVRRFTES